MNAPATIQTVHQLLEENIQTTDKLLTLLEEERTHLKQRNHTVIPALLEQKHQLMSRLEQTAAQRQQWLTQAPQQTDTQTADERWNTLLTDLGGPTLTKLWDTFKDNLTACQQNNEVNGRMIGRGQQSVRQLLTLLKGQVEAPTLYNQSGSTQSHSLSQTVVKA